MKYKHIFFDLDHTLWDFDANARAALEQLHLDLNLVDKGIHDFDLFHKNYLAHNEKLWARYRNGYIKQEELRLKRMWLTLLDFRIADEALARQLSELFLQLLPARTILFPGTMEILDYLRSRNYSLSIITNGFEETQQAKLRNSGLAPFFSHVVTSESSGFIKPQKEIFDYALSLVDGIPMDALMIGDTVDVDILGAMNAGIDQVHVNYNGSAQDLTPTYTINNLEELKNIL